jgi:hypothetical protein
MSIRIKCDIQCDVKREENEKRKGLSFIAARSTAEVSHKTTASPGIFCGSYCVQDGDRGNAICKGIGKKCTGVGGSDSDGRLTRKIVLYLVQEHDTCGYVSK